MQFPLLTTLLLSCAGASAPFAQDSDLAPVPAAELQKFAPMVGTWEGSGTFRMAPDAAEEKWTSATSFEWILGGHFLREDMAIQLAEIPTKLCMSTIYGWDAENQRYVAVGISNTGDAELSEVYFHEGALVTLKSGLEMGAPSLERWVTRYKDGVSKTEGQTATGVGPLFTYVKGGSKRTSEKPSKIERADAPLMPEYAGMVGDHHKKLSSAAGDYTFTGWMIMPGMPEKMEIAGRESFRPIYGGMVLEFHTESEPVGMYEAYGWMAWNEDRSCYDMVMVNSMGQAGHQLCHIVGGTWVFTGAANSAGEPTVSRGLLRIREDGSFGDFDSHTISGKSDPVHNFHAKYARKEK
jgi:hypothetical protein